MPFSPSVLVELARSSPLTSESSRNTPAPAARAHSAYARTLEEHPRLAHTRPPPSLIGAVAKQEAQQRRPSEDLSEEVANIMQGSPWTPRLTHLRRSPSSVSPCRSAHSGRSSAVTRSPSMDSLASSSTSDSSSSLPVWPRHWNRDKQARSRHSSSFNPPERATKCCWIPIRPAPTLPGQARWA